MLILLTNDDGYRAEGLAALRAALREVGRVVTVAPATEMSGVSHALTLGRPLAVETLGEDLHVVEGTPTDCVCLALARLLPGLPDVVVSGVNHGPNLGDDVTYSGTVGAAMEGALNGRPSLAVSQLLVGPSPDHGPAARLAAQLARALGSGALPLPAGTFLSMNVPAETPRGISLVRLARRRYQDGLTERRDDEGRRFFAFGGRPVWESEPGTDHHAVVTLRHASVSLLGTDLSRPLPDGDGPGRAVLERALADLAATAPWRARPGSRPGVSP